MPISALNVRELPELPLLWEIGAEEHGGDVGFLTGSRNKAVSRMCIEKYAV